MCEEVLVVGTDRAAREVGEFEVSSVLFSLEFGRVQRALGELCEGGVCGISFERRVRSVVVGREDHTEARVDQDFNLGGCAALLAPDRVRYHTVHDDDRVGQEEFLRAALAHHAY